jgi:hypothetical protein
MLERGTVDPFSPVSNIKQKSIRVSSGITASVALPNVSGSKAKVPDREVVVLDDDDSDDSDDDMDPPPPPPPPASTMNNESVLDTEDEDEDDPVDDEVDPPPPTSTPNNAMNVTAAAAAASPVTATSSRVTRGPNPDVLEAIVALSRAREIYEI